MLHPFIPYFDTKTPEYMEQTNISFLEAAMNFKVEKRPIYEVKIPAEMIHSGDFFLISRLDGLDPMIQYGTGSRGGHCTNALWFGDELYIVESQDTWYWPNKNIQRTPYAQWIEYAKEASYNTIWLPLNEEQRQKFDEKAA